MGHLTLKTDIYNWYVGMRDLGDYSAIEAIITEICYSQGIEVLKVACTAHLQVELVYRQQAIRIGFNHTTLGYAAKVDNGQIYKINNLYHVWQIFHSLEPNFIGPEPLLVNIAPPC